MVPTISPSLWSKRRRRWEGTTRKVVISEFITLDGVIEDPGGAEGFERGGWAFRYDRGPEGDRFKVRRADGQRRAAPSYAGFAAAWPSISDEVGFAER